MKQRPGLYIVFKDNQGYKVSLKEKKKKKDKLVSI